MQCTYENGRRILADVVAAGGVYQSPPTVSNGKVFVGGPDRFVRAIDAANGKEVWRFSDPTRPKKGMNATASASGDKVFISTTVAHDGMPCGGRLFCLDDKTGRVLWRCTGAGGWTGSSYTPDTVICGSSTEVFITCLALEPNPDKTPRIIRRTRVDGIFQESTPAIHGGRAFIVCSDGFLYSFQGSFLRRRAVMKRSHPQPAL